MCGDQRGKLRMSWRAARFQFQKTCKRSPLTSYPREFRRSPCASQTKLTHAAAPTIQLGLFTQSQIQWSQKDSRLLWIPATKMSHCFCVCFIDACRPSAFAIRKPQLDVISEATEEPSTAGMAEYLASIFGTEKDKVNCSFFFKVMVFKLSRLLRLPLATAVLRHLLKSVTF